MANIPVRSQDPLNPQGFRTQRAESPEDLWQPLYDRVNYAAGGSSSLAFFATPRGQSATLITQGTAASKVKTSRDTNIDNSNVVPTKLYKFVGMSVGYVHSNLTLATNANDRAIIRDGAYVNFRIVDKDILFLPLIAIPEMNPVAAVSSTATATSITAFASGGGVAVPMYKFPCAA